MSEYTPGKWRQDDGDIRSEDGLLIASVSRWRCTLYDSRPMPQDANAHRIVTACNAHDDLLAALEGLMDSAERYFIERKDEAEHDEYDTMMAARWKAARAAIARATTGEKS